MLGVAPNTVAYWESKVKPLKPRSARILELAMLELERQLAAGLTAELAGHAPAMRSRKKVQVGALRRAIMLLAQQAKRPFNGAIVPETPGNAARREHYRKQNVRSVRSSKVVSSGTVPSPEA